MIATMIQYFLMILTVLFLAFVLIPMLKYWTSYMQMSGWLDAVHKFNKQKKDQTNGQTKKT